MFRSGKKKRKERKKKKKIRKVKPRRYRIATVIIPYIVLLFCVPRAIAS